MKRLAMTSFSLQHPWLVVGLTAIVTLFFAAQFPKVHFDNDPENMLAEDEYVRVFHHQVKERFALYDFVIAGIVNESEPDGVFNVDTLQRIDQLTKEILSLHQNEDGDPVITRAGEEIALDLHPKGIWQQVLNVAFHQDPHRLFQEDGSSVIINREIISPSVVDNIRQAELGQLKIEYLMEEAPQNRDEALEIREDALSNPLYRGTLVSEDGRALALYLPITKKIYSYNVASLVRELTSHWPETDQVHITGLPVAEDTFGVEMLVQMATSAPLAGLAIFLLLFFFFRRLSLIVAPMVLAMVSVICTMGLLIGLGFEVHIMSSMIAIFLMPIAVADSVHVLSEFFDTYHRFRDRAETLRYVIGHLFMPMLYTSLTTMAGFASLALTPIPPVRVFGLHVAFGVGLAWFLTMTLVPAFVILFVPKRALKTLSESAPTSEAESGGFMGRVLMWMGSFSFQRWRVVLSTTLVVIVIAAVGISRIEVNDNPVKWFVSGHPIRIADRVLNDHFGGTYTAYMKFSAEHPDDFTCKDRVAYFKEATTKTFGETRPHAAEEFIALLDKQEQEYSQVNMADQERCFHALVEKAIELDAAEVGFWEDLGNEINYLDPEDLTLSSLRSTVALMGLPDAVRESFLESLSDKSELKGEELLNAALGVVDKNTGLSFEDFVYRVRAEVTAPIFKRPKVLRYIERLQNHLAEHPIVGKTNSAVDALKKASYELNYVPGGGDSNQAYFSVPATAAAVGQVFTQLEGMKKKDSLFHLVTRDYRELNLWVQLKSGDNKDMESVVQATARFLEENPAPVALDLGWAGLTYLNVVWQEKMVSGMLSSLGSSFLVVALMMMLLFRSPVYGLFAMIPLSVTIAFIYGLIGLVGKDYDMPVAVLSALTLGLSVDFAIHFLQRSRELQRSTGSWQAAILEVFREPARAISRNAIIISVGFTPLLFAPLVPYKTVGFFLATIMAVSWLATLFILAALVTMFQRYLFSNQEEGRA